MLVLSSFVKFNKIQVSVIYLFIVNISALTTLHCAVNIRWQAYWRIYCCYGDWGSKGTNLSGVDLFSVHTSLPGLTCITVGRSPPSVVGRDVATLVTSRRNSLFTPPPPPPPVKRSSPVPIMGLMGGYLLIPCNRQLDSPGTRTQFT